MSLERSATDGLGKSYTFRSYAPHVAAPPANAVAECPECGRRDVVSARATRGMRKRNDGTPLRACKDCWRGDVKGIRRRSA